MEEGEGVGDMFDICCSEYPRCKCPHVVTLHSVTQETHVPVRDDWDTYFMKIARDVASRATCNRKHVGAVIVRDKHILATGYNGSISGLEHCDDAGHMMKGDHCQRTVHAEANAIIQAAKHGVSIDRAMIYITASPCWPCFKMLANAGMTRIVYGEPYRLDETMVTSAKRVGIELTLHASE